MYKKKIILVFVICSTFVVNAQNFKKDDLLIDLGSGFGESWFTKIKAKPTFNVSVETGIVEITNFATLGIGAYGYSNNNKIGEDEFSSTVIAAKSILHFTFFNSKRIDFYAGESIGIFFYQHNYYLGNKLYFDDGILPYWSVIIGTRFMVNDKFGFFAELHQKAPLINGGITIKF